MFPERGEYDRQDLIVDDDRSTLLLVTGRLVKLEYSVMTASDGEKALEIARMIKPVS